MSDQFSIRIIEANYRNPEHGKAIAGLVDAYSRDVMGRGEPLGEDELVRLVKGLSENPCCFTLLAFDGKRPVGIANCITGYSTFAAAPLVNIHDLAVLEDVRGRGVGAKLLEAVDERARAMNCCKVTMEVRTDNPARRLYARHGFGDDNPPLHFWHKKL
jgi:ribosomal protein S18 acetylase RimI-like enzyme